MHTGDDFGHTSFDTGLLPEIGDIFACLADDDTSLFGTDKSAEGEDVVSGRRGSTGVGSGAWQKFEELMDDGMERGGGLLPLRSAWESEAMADEESEREGRGWVRGRWEGEGEDRVQGRRENESESKGEDFLAQAQVWSK